MMSLHTRTLSLLLAILTLSALCGCSAAPAAKSAPAPYGVFLGMEPGQALKIGRYDLAVIDAAEFSKAQIAALHKKAGAVYSYLDVGSLEDYRPYYQRFKHLSLGKYSGWKGEYWADVSDADWQAYLTRTLAPALKQKGVDGLFLDNFDVYGEFPRAGIYQGLLSVLRGLHKQHLPVIVNGGDAFVSRALKRGDLKGLAAGVNQESVFTADADGSGMTARAQDADTSAYYRRYLTRCAKAGLEVYVIEYGASGALRKKAAAYCADRGWNCWFAKSQNLDSE
jgi:hypothetical protein